MKQRKKTLALSALAASVVMLAVGIGIYIQHGTSPLGKGVSDSQSEADSGGKDTGDTSSGDTGEAGEIKTEYTEEEKEAVESQTGVSVLEDGTVSVDIGSILEEEVSVKIKREETYDLVRESFGEETQIESADIREYEGTKYWAVHATKNNETYQVWINADNGEEFINQRDE